jgi:hypothetical protein
MLKWKDVGALLLAYPDVGLSHCLAKDKQLEIAHVARYCRDARDVLEQCKQGTIHPKWTFRLRSLLMLDLRDLHVEDNVRKRPFSNKI